MHSQKGSTWNRWDLHFHTPASFDYENFAITNKQLVDRLIDENIRVVAVTDHHKIDIPRIQELQTLGGGRLTVLPGIELRSDHGGDPIHYICLFAQDVDLTQLWTTLQGQLRLTDADVKATGDDKVYVPIEDATEVVRRFGGLISIHAGSKSNSIESIRNREQFQQRIKYDITAKYVDIMEIGQIKDVETHLKVIFPKTGLDKPLVVCSDNHNVLSYSVKSPLWIRADPCFRGLRMAICEPHGRFFIGTVPLEVTRVQQNKTKFIQSMSFSRSAGAPAEQKWFDGTVTFNSGLVAIVGNKGSGKSALADMLGLLGATKNSQAFSFLCPSRFRHPSSGYANHFEATLKWEDGETNTQRLDAKIDPESVERVKYLPQDHVEKVCNELTNGREGGFEAELKAVIFSHVPDAQRLKHQTLDALVQFQTEEKQKRIDSLVKQLRELSRSRSALELQADPATRKELEAKLKRKQQELLTHETAKPLAKPNPAEQREATAQEAATLETLKLASAKIDEVRAKLQEANTRLGDAERRHAVAARLGERLGNILKEFAAAKNALAADATELGLSVDDLVTFNVNRTSVDQLHADTATAITTEKNSIESFDPPGLSQQLKTLESEVTTLQSTLDGPSKEYQQYLKALDEWETKRKAINGATDDPDSLTGLNAMLSSLDGIPAKVVEVQRAQLQQSLEIHAQKVAQAAIYRALYGPVQNFIDTHHIARNKLNLEFRAELANDDFTDRLLCLLALNRTGSFMGNEAGRARANSYVQSTDWEDVQSVERFLKTVDEALHTDQRDPANVKAALLRDQLLKGKKSEEVYDALYGLDYLRPRYVLRWEGKDLALLSPGERGTLLLVFYLLIDKGDIPLVIDQPEGNLDNHTVAKALVDCIKEARKRRQVFIVTHNPNLAVVCDADQVIHATMRKEDGSSILYESGALENPVISKLCTDVLEGTHWAFSVRGDKYKVCRDIAAAASGTGAIR